MSLETAQPVAPIRSVYAIHGFHSSPQKRLFQWLKLEAITRGAALEAVELPCPDAPVARHWQDALDRQLPELDTTTGLVTHSLGGITALRYLTRDTSEWSLGTLVLVAPFASTYAGMPEEIRAFCEDVDWDTIRSRTASISVIRSDNDTLVPATASDHVAEKLGVEPIIVAGKGHFRDSENVVQVPEIRDAVFGS
ncbi:Putative hydrolase YdeN [Corynebacterium ciconiae DSM 44920]|uniref:RBBP9/YdeN family alpha/beta hydrolase n=1 Tax=Corynebacterium ciconiae TaxID=227319 RepID=UPI00036BF66A|nr:alpha/beta hydrolase [Corynebacterium ciconiae]WKD62127.1 Putative hydrolase YdeN [Corynebacterium ciconiae DSM 44920]